MSSGNGTSTSVTTSSIQTTQYNLIWVGIGVSVGGNFLISLSFQIQKAVHNQLQHLPECEKIPYTKMPRWWFGLLCMAFGEVGNFLAYGMAPASLVSPLGAVTVVSNAILSRVILKESLSYRKIIGILFSLFGAVLIAINAPSPQSGASGSSGAVQEQPDTAIYDSLISWRAFIYLCIVIFLAAYIANPLKLKIAVSEEFAKQQVWCYCLICGLLGAITIMSSKGISTALNQAFAGDPKMLTDGRICWLTYLLIVSAAASIVLQMKFLNAALETFDSGKVVPVYYIIFTTITISAGMCLFLEISFDPLVRSVLLFVLGLLLAFFGVFLIGGDSDGSTKHVELPKEEEDVLKLVFNDLDRDKNSFIDRKEICALATALKEEWKDDGAEMMSLMDTDQSGEVSFEEFKEWYAHVTAVRKELLKRRAEEITRELNGLSNVVGVTAPGSIVYSAIRMQNNIIKKRASVADNSRPSLEGRKELGEMHARSLTSEDRKETFRTTAKKFAMAAGMQNVARGINAARNGASPSNTPPLGNGSVGAAGDGAAANVQGTAAEGLSIAAGVAASSAAPPTLMLFPPGGPGPGPAAGGYAPQPYAPPPVTGMRC